MSTTTTPTMPPPPPLHACICLCICGAVDRCVSGRLGRDAGDAHHAPLSSCIPKMRVRTVDGGGLLSSNRRRSYECSPHIRSAVPHRNSVPLHSTSTPMRSRCGASDASDATDVRACVLPCLRVCVCAGVFFKTLVGQRRKFGGGGDGTLTHTHMLHVIGSCSRRTRFLPHDRNAFRVMRRETTSMRRGRAENAADISRMAFRTKTTQHANVDTMLVRGVSQHRVCGHIVWI